MNKILRTGFIGTLSLLLVSHSIRCQEDDPYMLLDSLKSRLETIETYAADIEIEVDVDFINMPVKHARIHYQKPDKLKFKSDEFIMLPRRGLTNQISKIMNEPFTAIMIGNELYDNQDHAVIRIVPMGKKPDVVMATAWINLSNYLLSKSESTTRNDGSYTVLFTYGDPTIVLPTQMTFQFNIEKLNLPLKFIGQTSGMEIDKSKMQDSQEGAVYIRFSNYSINSQEENADFKE